ncbi:GIY-YIG nuclease family protein [Aquiflexum balticum]|uniref:GIY-YIG nuclease family protein n=1 Tax=Aquiflexum balticum TaxID=280473 RepID=UPI0012FC5A58
MDFYIYILYSATFDKFYIGHPENPWRRVEEHNSGIHHNLLLISDLGDLQLSLDLQDVNPLYQIPFTYLRSSLVPHPAPCHEHGYSANLYRKAVTSNGS